MKNKVHAFLMAMLFALTISAQDNTGLASYYAPQLHGGYTSNGEIYDHQGFTCANKQYPLNTVLKVTRMDDGRSINVRVNDCGPHVQGRIVDLSGAAAEEIGLLTDGITKVKVEVIKMGDFDKSACGLLAPYRDQQNAEFTTKGGNTENTTKKTAKGYGVQVAAFRDYQAAINLQEKLLKQGANNVMIEHANVYKVIFGPYRDRENASIFLEKSLHNYNLEGYVLKLPN